HRPMSSTAVTPRMTHPWRRRADLAAAAAAPGSAASVAVPVTEGSGCRFSPAIRTSRLLQIPVRARFLALLGEHNAGQPCPAAAEIAAATGNDAVAFLPLDLADLASVRNCAAEFLARGEPLHVLINNAGVAGARGLTKDGFELGFGINHLGHFALTTALLDCL